MTEAVETQSPTYGELLRYGRVGTEDNIKWVNDPGWLVW